MQIQAFNHCSKSFKLNQNNGCMDEADIYAEKEVKEHVLNN